jgi:TonB family protein
LRSFSKLYQSVSALLPTIFILIVTVSAVAQSTALTNESPGPDPTMARIERARALAAAHQLGSAASELESVRASVKDTALRNITTLMLIGVYLEEGNYVRPVALLDETFQARSTQKDDSVRAYFALAGQTIIGVRSRLARYRSFGINVRDRSLPTEALRDLDHIRFLLERLIAQANDVTNENGRAYDAWALKEDVLGIRLSLARDEEDRVKWQTEYAGAREKLASRQIQIASLGRPPALEAVTAKIPNPFAGPKPTGPTETNTTLKKEEVAQPVPTPEPTANPQQETAAPTTSTAPAESANTPPANPEPRTFSTGSFHGRERKSVKPIYPDVARRNGITGTVRVFILVDVDGTVSIKRSEGPLALREAAEQAAKKWIFRPVIVDGQPVRVSAYLDFDFNPQP